MNGLNLVPRPKFATGRINHAATIGARPKVDSSDRSMPPISRIRLSPTTTTPSAETCCPTPVRFEVVRNAGLTIEPTTTRMTSTGSSAAPRTNPTAARPRLRPSTAGACRGRCEVGLAHVRHRDPLACRRKPLGGRDQLLAVKRRLAELGEDPPTNEHDNALADLQVVELVAGQQQARAGTRG